MNIHPLYESLKNSSLEYFSTLNSRTLHTCKKIANSETNFSILDLYAIKILNSHKIEKSEISLKERITLNFKKSVLLLVSVMQRITSVIFKTQANPTAKEVYDLFQKDTNPKKAVDRIPNLEEKKEVAKPVAEISDDGFRVRNHKGRIKHAEKGTSKW